MVLNVTEVADTEEHMTFAVVEVTPSTTMRMLLELILIVDIVTGLVEMVVLP